MEYIKGKDNVLSDTMSRPNIAAATVAAVMADQGNMYLYEITCGIDVLSLPSDKEWHDEQANDPFCFPYIKYLTNKEVPEDHLKLCAMLISMSLMTIFFIRKLSKMTIQ